MAVVQCTCSELVVMAPVSTLTCVCTYMYMTVYVVHVVCMYTYMYMQLYIYGVSMFWILHVHVHVVIRIVVCYKPNLMCALLVWCTVSSVYNDVCNVAGH